MAHRGSRATPLLFAAHAVALASLAWAPVQAQTRGNWSLGLAGGVSDYDLSGTGSTFVVAGRLDRTILTALVVEVGLTYFQYEPQLSSTTDRLLFPEIAIQAQLPLGPVYPYLGGGGGLVAALSGTGGGEPTLHAAAGIRAHVAATWRIRAEFRVRAVDPFGAVTADLTLGVGRRL